MLCEAAIHTIITKIHSKRFVPDEKKHVLSEEKLNATGTRSDAIPNKSLHFWLFSVGWQEYSTCW
jgi:hypothetical protein